MNAPLSLSWLAQQFADDSQSFTSDATAVHATLIHDPHTESLELTVEVFGTPAGENAPVAVARIDNLADYVCEPGVLDGEPVPALAVLSLFEAPALAALLAQGDAVRWLWNPGFATPAPTAIDAAHPGATPPLLPAVQ